MKFETRAIHVGEEPNIDHTGDVTIPIHLASTYARKYVDIPTKGHEYSRSDNPTRLALEHRLAVLEDAKYGLAFSSGLAAETNLLLSLLKAGDHIVAFDDLYGGTRRLFDKVFEARFDISLTYVDATNLDLVEKSLQDNTKIIWLETPTNPLLRICDIRKISQLAHKKEIIVVVDNTFLSPYFQQPLNLGADIVLHSTTKYINGHSDAVGGCVMLNNDKYFERLQFTQNAAGAIMSPFDSYLVLRGLKTLGIRMNAHQKNGLILAEYLKNRQEVRQVIYLGLQEHPQYSLISEQSSGFGGMLSFELDADLEISKRFVENLKIFATAESLGGVESLIELPAIMTHASIAPEERNKIGLSDSLIRMSVGIEHPDDLIEDLDQAFEKMTK
ncbi:MAG: aminotransferase class I/II-fold pyridoxal phosphate-dependent enzyme [Planctomycetia bacterium]|nr:aminotransferase class I/II-fold pyridoxal phosphate-dependent enzyme [Planctomycetia bacterium]